MAWRRGWISVFLFTLAMINYVDRVGLSVAAKPISEEFGLSPVWLLLLLFTLSLAGMATAISLNFSLVNDLLRNPEDAGKAMSILIVGGNAFGIAAPIVTGHVIGATGNYSWAFGIAGALLVSGALILLTMTRRPIELPAAA